MGRIGGGPRTHVVNPENGQGQESDQETGVYIFFWVDMENVVDLTTVSFLISGYQLNIFIRETGYPPLMMMTYTFKHVFTYSVTLEVNDY